MVACRTRQSYQRHFHLYKEEIMKKSRLFKGKKPDHIPKEPIRNILMEEGKFIHGIKGKPTRGARGNKKY